VPLALPVLLLGKVQGVPHVFVCSSADWPYSRTDSSTSTTAARHWRSQWHTCEGSGGANRVSCTIAGHHRSWFPLADASRLGFCVLTSRLSGRRLPPMCPWRDCRQNACG
jgi:hypothetical protein